MVALVLVVTIRSASCGTFLQENSTFFACLVRGLQVLNKFEFSFEGS